MGSARVVSCLMIGLLGVLLGVLPGCQPLYGNKPEKLHKPEPKKRPPEVDLPPPEIKYVEECNASFHDPPKPDKDRDQRMAGTLIGEGDTALASSDKAKDPAASAGLIKDSIDKYINALRRDPYNADATLKLAIAYDRVYRKGCAIAMLKRLASMTKNPKYGKQADLAADSINDNSQWFKGYRKDAMSAAGR